MAYPFFAPWRFALICLLVLPAAAGFVALSVSPASAATTEQNLKKTLLAEEQRAKARRDSLKRLTEQERQLNTGLAQAEDGILAIEKKLSAHRKRLSELDRDSDSAQNEYERLLKERRRTENSLRSVLRTLWELHSRKVGVHGRELEDWPVTDREYYWGAELFKAVNSYRVTIEEQELALDEVVSRRHSIGQQVTTEHAKMEMEKSALLEERIKYEQRLATTRKQKNDAEAELRNILRLINEINLDIKAQQGVSRDIAKAKGKLMRPSAGKVALRFNPNGNPAVRGLGFATSTGAPVRAAHPGVVMFNDTMRGLGRVVVVQHGEAYFTIYAFLSEISVNKGQNVERGQNLGKAGYYPDIKGSGLYFELRHHQSAVNPETWLDMAG